MVENNKGPEVEEPKPRRVLVVEDDEGLNILAQRALSKAGYDTAGVFNGTEAIERVLAYPEVVLLLDIKLPDMTGSEIINTLIERNCPVPFIVMTGHGDERTAVEMMKLGAGDYLVKELDLVERLPGAFRRLFHELDTERRLRAAEEALRESRERYQELYNEAPVGYHEIDLEGIIKGVNQTEAEILGYTIDEMIGKPVWEFMTADQRVLVEQSIQVKLEIKRDLEAFERQFQRKDGSVLIAYLEDRLVWDEDRQIVGFRTTMQDITERKRTEEALRESEEHYRELVEKAGIAIVMDDQEGNFDYFNEQFVKIFGYPPDEIKQHSIRSLVHPDDVEMVMSYHQARMQGREAPTRYEFKGIKKNGKTVFLEVDVVCLKKGKSIIGTRSYFWDITERKALEEMWHRYEAIVNTSTDFLTLINRDYVYRAVNDAYCQAHGKSRDEILGRKVADIWGKEVFNEVIKGYLKRCLEGEQIQYEAWFSFDHRSEQCFEVTYYPYRDEENIVTHAIIATRDITERKQAEEALRESEERFKQMTEQAPFVFELYDKDGLQIDVNPAYEELWDFPKETTLNSFNVRKSQEVVDTGLMEYVLRAYSGESVAPPEYSFDSRKEVDKGRPRWLNTRIYPLKNKSNEVTNIVIMHEDITERKQAEEALQTSEDKYRLLTETADEGIYILGPTGFEYVNPAFQRTTGYPAEKLLRKDFDFMDLIHPDDKDLVLARTKAREKGDKIPSRYEFRLVPRDKEVRDLEISTVELPGEPWRVMGIYRDITERKQAERQLRSLAAHLASAREETMIAISRDLHDELGQILTGLKMDAAWLNGKIPDEQQPLKEKVESIVGDLNDTIQVVKRITAQLRPVILDNQGLVPALRYEIQEFKKRTGIECNITIEPPELTTDKDYSTVIYRILQESLTNIKKHARASKVVISLKAGQKQLVLQVQDNGIGITKEQTERTGAYGILGMRERILHLDGEIKIQGAQGQGTQLSVTIPVKRKD